VTRTELERIASLETRVDEIVIPGLTKLDAATDRIEARLDDLSLNGHGPDLRRFVVEDMPLLRDELIPHVKALVTRAQHDEDAAAADRALRHAGGWGIRWSDLQRQMRWVPALLLTLAGAGAYALISFLASR